MMNPIVADTDGAHPASLNAFDKRAPRLFAGFGAAIGPMDEDKIEIGETSFREGSIHVIDSVLVTERLPFLRDLCSEEDF